MNGGASTEADAVTWRALWKQTTDSIGDQMHARWICETASAAADGDEFLRLLDHAASQRMVSHLDAMIARYATGEPLQYVLGRWAFRHLDLAVDPRVLIPRPETELVAERAIERAAAIGPVRTVVDLGTGSGAIGLSLAAELPIDGTTVWITDVDDDALDVARANLAGLGRRARSVRIGAGSWYEALPADLRADVIVSNPPYVAENSPDLDAVVSEWEPDTALFGGPDGLDEIEIIVAGASSHLLPGGSLIIEIGFDQGRAVGALMSTAGFIDIAIEPDAAGHDRVASGRLPVTRLRVTS